VDSQSASVDVRDSPWDPQFLQSSFRVELIDNYGYLQRFFRAVDNMVRTYSEHKGAHGPPVVAVDFEGVKLCRTGELCLAQFSLSTDPYTVYVLDVFKLGKNCFRITSPRGASVQSILEEPSIRKIWFDPRNDVDALAHQFGIRAAGIFDLQLAEVGERRSRGLNVRYVQGLFKCLCGAANMTDDHKVFAEKIDHLGKNLFEPDCGGSYEVFRARPLHPIILVYAAHDVRYMLMLYEDLCGRLMNNPEPQTWFERVQQASAVRGNWWTHPTYLEPNSDAPEF
jgi:exonuclease 3'-5' domain-containing protein 1